MKGKWTGTIVASTVAVLLTAGWAGAEAEKSTEPKKIPCYGVNECKGKGECASKGLNGCSGKNGCKGKGWINMTEEECKKKGGKTKPEEKE